MTPRKPGRDRTSRPDASDTADASTSGHASKTSKPEKNPPNAFAGLRALRDKLAKEESAKENERAHARAKENARSPSPPASPSRGRASRDRIPSATANDDGDEALEFHRLMSGVTPLDDKNRRVAPRAAIEPARRVDRGAAPEDTTMEHLRVLVDEGSTFEVTDDGRRVEGHRVDVPAEFVRRLRRGGFPIDGTLDLHGRTESESKKALEAFLRDKRARGERCVLIVHGKGSHSPAGVGILRGEMSAWLSQGPASAHVAAFTTALESDGGEGAVYVLLRR
jgi:DNA-nicking Smr family endonuclease